MSIRCPRCGREFDVTLFEYRRTVRCPCGRVLSMDDGHAARDERERPDDGRGTDVDIDWEALERELFGASDAHEAAHDRERAAALGREADRIVSMILFSDMPRIDIEIAIRAFRERVLAEFPEKEELFTALYLGRFRRIWRQFRDRESGLLMDEP